MPPFEITADFAARLDEEDELKHFRERFFIPRHAGKDCIYLTGNSLGLQPRTVAENIRQELDDWANLGVEGHFHAKRPWMPYHEIFPKQLGMIVGAKENEVVAMNSLTVNLHLLMVSFYRPTEYRHKIICEARAFPSDQYAFESQVRFHGLDPSESIIEITPREGEHHIRTEDILSLIKQHGESVALIIIGAVNYYSGQFYDIEKITAAGHEVGAKVGFDCAHAAGNVELKLHDWEVDFACWCSYKYLNSGPGGIGGVYIHEKHAGNKNLLRFAGWWGYKKETRFKMEKGFDPIPTAEGWQLSNAPILSMAAHKAALDIFEEAGMERLHKKRKRMAGYLRFIVNEINSRNDHDFIEPITPENENERGCQLSLLMLKDGRKVFEILSGKGVIADWREPNVIRVAPVPLYNRFTDIFEFGKIISDIVN